MNNSKKSCKSSPNQVQLRLIQDFMNGYIVKFVFLDLFFTMKNYEKITSN